MKPKYIIQTGVQVTVVDLDTNLVAPGQVSIRVGAGVSVLGSLENPSDWVQTDTISPSVAVAQGVVAAGMAGPVWSALPAAVNGVIVPASCYRALQFTSTSGTVVSTVLQQGIQ